MKFRIIFLIFNILVHFSINAQITLDSILNNHLRITGLANLHQEIKSFAIEGEIVQKNVSFPIKIKGIVPDKFRMDMSFNQLNFINVSNGIVKWEYNPMTDSVSEANANGNEAQEFIDRWCGAVSRFKQDISNCKLMGINTIDDIEVYKIEFRVKDQSRVYYIDKYSYLIVRIDDDFVESKITYYTDYRKSGKYLLPFNLTGYEAGVPVMSMKFKEVKINPEITESIFSKPK